MKTFFPSKNYRQLLTHAVIFTYPRLVLSWRLLQKRFSVRGVADVKSKRANIMILRKLHRIVGLIFAPFFIITAVTGGVLLFSRHYRHEVKKNLLAWHNWEGVSHYAGLILAAGLLFMAVTGVGLWLQMTLRKRRAPRSAAGKRSSQTP
jgi:uncharacterized iron-regulated membrane protein